MRICEVIADKKYKRILITIAEKQGAIDSVSYTHLTLPTKA